MDPVGIAGQQNATAMTLEAISNHFQDIARFVRDLQQSMKP